MNNQEKGKFARKLVMDKLISLGGNNITPIKEGKASYILAKNSDGSRSVKIRVKSRFKGDWQTSTDEGKPREENPDERNYWIFVDLVKLESIQYYIVPEWWIQNDIYDTHNEYEKRHGHKRPINPDAKHHSIALDRIAHRKDRWDLLQIF